VNPQNQGVIDEPYDLNIVKTLADATLSQSTKAFEVRNMATHKQM